MSRKKVPLDTELPAATWIQQLRVVYQDLYHYQVVPDLMLRTNHARLVSALEWLEKKNIITSAT